MFEAVFQVYRMYVTGVYFVFGSGLCETLGLEWFYAGTNNECGLCGT